MKRLLPFGNTSQLPAGSGSRPSALGGSQRWLLAAAASLLGLGAAQAQTLNFRSNNVQNVAGTYTDLGASGTAITMASSDDANSSAQNIGFVFNYNGTAFSQFVMSTNGLVRLGATAPSSAALYPTYAQDALTGSPVTSATDTNLLLPFNVDLEAGTGTPAYSVLTTGTSPNQVCTIQWKNVSDKAKSASSTVATAIPKLYSNMSFQVKLYEGTNNVEFVYDAPTLNTTNANFKAAVVGIKGSGSAVNQVILGTKGSTQPASATTFLNANYTGNGFNFRNNNGAALIDAGRTFRFQAAQAVDAAVLAIYNKGKLPIGPATPDTIRAYIQNQGTSQFSGQQITLTVRDASNATVFTTTRTVAAYLAGAGGVVTFAPWTPTAAGTYTATVTVPADGIAGNNSLVETIEANATGLFGYVPSTVNTATLASIGNPTVPVTFASRFVTNTARTVTGVNMYVTAAGTVTAQLFDAAGNVLASSAATASAVGYRTFTFPTPVVIGAGYFLVGGLITANTRIGFMPETPTRTNTFYQITAGPVLNDLSANGFGRAYIEAQTSAPPACAPPTGLTVGSVTNTGATLSFSNSGSATSYTVTYTPTGGTATTLNPNPTGTPVVLSGLTPGTAYTVSVTSNCSGSTTSTSVTGSFTTLFSNEAALDVLYTQGQLPIPFGAPHVVRAVVRNAGQNTLTNFPVTLTVSGANTFSNVQTIASLAPGASATVTFAGYTPTATGTNTVAVTISDDNPANNTRSQPQVVSSTTFGYATTGAGIASSVGYNAGTGLLLNRYTTSAPRVVTAVNVFLATAAATAGKTVRAVVVDASGTIIGSSADYVILAADLGTLKSFTIPGTVIVPAGAFFVGLGQTTLTGSGYFPVGTQDELPTRSGAYYTAPLAGGSAPGDAASSNLGRFYIEAVTADLPACGPVTNLATSSVTGTSANVTFTPGNANTSYTLTYTPAGGSALTATGTASPISLTGLTPGTTYSLSLVASCSGSPTTAVTGTLYTVPTNDQCAGAIAVACGGTTTGTTLGSTSTNDPSGTHAGGTIFAAAGGVWYSFAGTGDRVTMSLCSSANTSFDSQLFVFSGSCGSLTDVAADDDGCSVGGLSTVTFLSTSGTTYYAYVTGFVNGGVPSRSAFTLSTTCTSPDLLVSTAQVVSGTYRNVTIAGPNGAAVLTDNLTVTGTMTVQSGGTLTTSPTFFVQGPGSFVLQAGGTIIEPNAAGIVNDGNGGFDLSGTLTLSPDANFVFNASTAQVTGALLPARVRNLTVNNSATPLNRTLTLSNSLSVAQLVRLQSGNLVLNGRSLVLLSAASGTALIDNTGGTVNGATGQMQRAITSAFTSVGYRHFSSPVSGSRIDTLSTGGAIPVVNPAYNSAAQPGLITPFPTVYGYDEARIASTTNNFSDFNKGWFSPNGGSDAMVVGKGYTVQAAATPTPVHFTGTFNNGTQNSGALSRGPSADAGWHLLGNPYPSPLDWSTVGAAQRPGMDAAMYVYQATSQYNGTYRAYANGVGSSPLIDAGSGYFVRTAAAGTPGAVNLTNTNRVTTFGPQPAFGRGSFDTRPQLQLQVAGAGVADLTHLYFEAGATTGVDVEYDATKLANPTGLNLASLVGQQALAINGLPSLAGTRETVVPLTLAAPAAGSFTFTVGSLANFGATTVYLRDALTGTQQLLAAGDTYPFTLATAMSGTGRFALAFRPSGALASATALDAASVSVYPNPAHGKFTVLLPPVAGASAVQAELLNVLGQSVTTRTIGLTAAGASAEFETSALAKGVYMLRLTAGSLTLAQRVVVE
ncbi:fibronectin type III domain-containing protein [Hymenobacter sp. ASUV-10]|uniref:Fibronectin type III domain-containing protein n=1 Tax=Hymenobacter aranciens TaxID=3063996 RepID=A0ABT9B577_9BACT|nr:fibronectin type III domain-containing protein [Hymenobacter sp. ASUV-10]MDO7873380.1 fibronectin type III domain-containing protein [Hymenobacter sp. ASUV-10]